MGYFQALATFPRRSGSCLAEIPRGTRRKQQFRIIGARSIVHAFIIEDDYLIGQSLQDLLTDLGFSSFSFARSEDAAIAGASGEKFDLITADARLLPGDGLRAVEAIRRDRHVPVIFITAYAEELQERLQGRLADTPILQKPIKADDLAAAVRQVLGTA